MTMRLKGSFASCYSILTSRCTNRKNQESNPKVEHFENAKFLPYYQAQKLKYYRNMHLLFNFWK